MFFFRKEAPNFFGRICQTLSLPFFKLNLTPILPSSLFSRPSRLSTVRFLLLSYFRTLYLFLLTPISNYFNYLCNNNCVEPYPKGSEPQGADKKKLEAIVNLRKTRYSSKSDVYQTLWRTSHPRPRHKFGSTDTTSYNSPRYGLLNLPVLYMIACHSFAPKVCSFYMMGKFCLIVFRPFRSS
jgi:hypothetical protein